MSRFLALALEEEEEWIDFVKGEKGEIKIDFDQSGSVLEAYRLYTNAQAPILLSSFKSAMREAEKAGFMKKPTNQRRYDRARTVLLAEELKRVEAVRAAKHLKPVSDFSLYAK